MGADRRDSTRFPVQAGQVQVECAGALALAVRDLSASGSQLLLHSGPVEYLERVPLTFHLGAHPPFRARLQTVRTASDPAGELVGVQFLDLDRLALASLARFLIEQSRGDRRPGLASALAGQPLVALTGAGIIRRLLRRFCLLRGHPLEVQRGNGPPPLKLQLLGFGAEDLVTIPYLSGGEALLRVGEQVEVAFLAGSAISVFQSRVLDLSRGAVHLQLPREIRQGGFRSSLRYPLPPGRPLHVLLCNPKLADHLVDKLALEVGGRGLSVACDPDQDLLFPGERIARAGLALPDGLVLADLAVRSMGRRGGSAALICGLEIQRLLDPGDQERWHRFVLGLGHPQLELAGGHQAVAAWSVLASSGYLEETTAAIQEHLARRFLVSWGRHAAEGRVARLLLLQRGKRPVGTIAANLLYPRTWILHHFGLDREARDLDRVTLLNLAREIYSGLTYVLQHLTPLDHFVLYINATRAWNRMIYDRFLQSYPARDAFLFDAFRVYRHTLAADEPGGEVERPETGGGWTLGPVEGRAQRRRLSRELGRRVSPLEHRAYAYGADLLDLGRFNRECAALGYERERLLLLGQEEGAPSALLMAEVGEEGINVFNLLNRCWLVPLRDRPPGEALVRALLERARRFYQRRGKREFLYLERREEAPLAAAEALGLRCQVEVNRWLARREMLPAYLSYLRDLMEVIRG